MYSCSMLLSGEPSLSSVELYLKSLFVSTFGFGISSYEGYYLFSPSAFSLSISTVLNNSLPYLALQPFKINITYKIYFLPNTIIATCNLCHRYINLMSAFRRYEHLNNLSQFYRTLIIYFHVIALVTLVHVWFTKR